MAKKKPIITRKMATKRLMFAKKYLDRNESFWSRVLFTDETCISIDRKSAMQRVRRSSFTDPFSSKFISPTTKHPLNIMIWGCFSSNGVGTIEIVDGYVNSEKYIQILTNNFRMSAEKLGITQPILLDDSAPCHRSAKVFKYKEEAAITSMDWPGNSPDLNPIENLWSFLKRRVAMKKASNKDQLITNIKNAWEREIPRSLCEKLVSSMNRRLKDVIDKKGYQTKY